MRRGIATILFVVGGMMVGLQLYLNSTGRFYGGHLLTVGGTLALIGLARLLTKHATRYAEEFLEQRAPWARIVWGGFLMFAGICWLTVGTRYILIAVPVGAGGMIYVVWTFYTMEKPPPIDPPPPFE